MSDASGWRKVESKGMGGVADRIRWVDGWSQRQGDEEGGVSRPVGDTGRISRRGMLSRKDDDRQPRVTSFDRPCGVGGGDGPKRCVVSRSGRSCLAPASTWPSRDGWKQLRFTSGQMVPSCGIALLQAPWHESPCTELLGLSTVTGGLRRSIPCLSVSHAARNVQHA